VNSNDRRSVRASGVASQVKSNSLDGCRFEDTGGDGPVVQCGCVPLKSQVHFFTRELASCLEGYM